jgi:predicted O-linked N-acetylglucosamine transferase (SPINDLY family)
MKQTAVEWLVERITKQHDKEFDLFYRAEIEQAKQMEKEQIIEAHFNGCEIGEMFNNENRAFITDSKQYYNETFKSE